MVTVTIDEFAAHVREYLPRVAAGEEVAITDRGRPVARLIADQVRLQRHPDLASTFTIVPATRPRPRRGEPAKLPGTPGSKIIQGMRRERDDSLSEETDR